MKFTKLEQIKNWRRFLHENPELSLKEYKTTEFIRNELDKMGLEYEAPMDTATVVKLYGKGEKYIVLRADIDALPIKEMNDIEFRSKNDGVMHACGHDAHATMLLGAINELSEISKSKDLDINILAIFQPSEESFGGANLLIENYNFDKYEIIGSFALHINPDYEEGTIISRIGPIMASCNEFAVNIKGKSAHVGKREEGINALNAAIQIYSQVQAIPTYDLDSKHTNIIHTGIVRAGEVMNSVPENAFLEGTIRTYDKDDFAIIKKRIVEICQGVSLSTKCEVVPEIRAGYPAVINSEILYDKSVNAAKKAKANHITRKDPYLLGEDFSFFGKIAPINYSFIGVRNNELGYTSGLHTPTLQLREEALIFGIDYFVEIAKSFGKE